MSVEVVENSIEAPVDSRMPAEARAVEREALRKCIEAYEFREEWLKENHNGKWAVFHDAEFYEAFDSFDAAAREATEKFGAGTCLIRRVGGPTSMPMPASVAFRAVHATR